MPHVALITSSYPDGTPGSEAAGSFVADFARELSSHLRVTVLAASTSDSVTIDGDLTVCRFAVPRTPLSLLKPFNPLDWMSIIRTLKSGRTALGSTVETDRPDHIFALWALPGGYWADSVAKQHDVPFSVWSLGSDIWTLGKIPLVRAKLRSVLRRAKYRFAHWMTQTELGPIHLPAPTFIHRNHFKLPTHTSHFAISMFPLAHPLTPHTSRFQSFASSLTLQHHTMDLP